MGPVISDCSYIFIDVQLSGEIDPVYDDSGRRAKRLRRNSLIKDHEELHVVQKLRMIEEVIFIFSNYSIRS